MKWDKLCEFCNQSVFSVQWFYKFALFKFAFYQFHRRWIDFEFICDDGASVNWNGYGSNEGNSIFLFHHSFFCSEWIHVFSYFGWKCSQHLLFISMPCTHLRNIYIFVIFHFFDVFLHCLGWADYGKRTTSFFTFLLLVTARLQKTGTPTYPFDTYVCPIQIIYINKVIKLIFIVWTIQIAIFRHYSHPILVIPFRHSLIYLCSSIVYLFLSHDKITLTNFGFTF